MSHVSDEDLAGLVRPYADPGESAAESMLRPNSLAEFEGQPRVSEQLGLVLEAARHRGGVSDHVLLSGPPGLGKTTLAMIIASEMNAPLRISSGPAIQHAGDLAAILSGLVQGEVFFLDEIHRMSRPAEEMLYLAMEDFRVDVVVGKAREQPRSPWKSHASRWLGRPPGPVYYRARCGTASASPLSSTFTTPRHWNTSCTAPQSCLQSSWSRPVPPRSPAAPAALRASPTGCSGGYVTTPRSEQMAG